MRLPATNGAASRNSRRVRRRCVVRRPHCRHCRKAEFFDYSQARHKSSAPNVRSREALNRLSFEWFQDVLAETWSEIPRREITTVLRQFTREIVLICAPPTHNV